MPLNNLNEHRDYFPTYPGEQTRTDHINCPAGTDTKKRLYIQLTPQKPHVYLGYCHNCGEGGVIKSGARYKGGKYKHKREEQENNRQEYVLPSTSEVINKSWLISNAHNEDLLDNITKIISQPDCVRLLAHYDGNRHRLLYPIWDTLRYDWENKSSPPITAGMYYGYNARAIYAHDRPKYYRITSPTFTGYSLYCNDAVTVGADNEYCYVLCEDQLSASRIPLAFEHEIGVCLYGTNHNIEKLHHLVERAGVNNVVYKVWFDNDSTIVKQHARVTVEYLHMLGAKRVGLVSNAHDPKHYDVHTLREKLCTTETT